MPDQVVDFLLVGMSVSDFYILCPDNKVTRDIANKRILWAAQDITKNRPALSRWHPDYKAEFDQFPYAVDEHTGNRRKGPDVCNPGEVGCGRCYGFFGRSLSPGLDV